MPEAVAATRMELLGQKTRLGMAERGHKLLKQKRDALVLEFFSTVKKARDLRSQVDGAMISAHKRLALARSVHGDLFVEATAMAAHAVPEVEVKTKNIMGVRIPLITAIDVRRTLLERGYSPLGSSAQFDDAVEAFENSLTMVVQLAETETSLKRLLKEIQKTNRRVNALEYNVQPMLKGNIRTIQDALNRLEAERFFALKLTKARIERKAEAEEQGIELD